MVYKGELKGKEGILKCKCEIGEKVPRPLTQQQLKLKACTGLEGVDLVRCVEKALGKAPRTLLKTLTPEDIKSLREVS